MTADTPNYEFSRPLRAESVHVRGRTEKLTATPAECAALARRFDIISVESLRAEIELRPHRRDGLALTGRLVADVTQACVVSLEPVPAHVEVAFERVFEPGAEDPEAGFSVEDLFDPDAEDPPEPLIDGIVDLGEVVAEELALSLDPYPRAPGAEIPAQYRAEPEDAAEKAESTKAQGTHRPFAVLKGGRDT
ncbi:YceD family protein [Zavarzinia sp.]|uniref:YceD family protein n=1 Tax=Zavarzinia sp. TaxID=2027920 RepID=UPI003BB53B31